MMKPLTLLLSLFIAISSFAQQEKLANSNLWKIEGNGLNTPSYLFGTMHFICDATLEKKVNQALSVTDQLVLELDMDDPEMPAKMFSEMYMNDGKTLSDFISADEFKAIDSLFINHMGMSVKMFQNIKPSLLSAMLFPKYFDCNPDSYEAVLMEMTKESNKDVLGLETVEEQMKVFDEIPYEEQVKSLVKLAQDGLAKDKAIINELQKVYKEENIEAMLKLFDDENYSMIQDYNDIILDQRNKKWITKIITFASEKPTFFGVGAGHLAGEKGVINLLRKEGYTVKAVLESE